MTHSKDSVETVVVVSLSTTKVMLDSIRAVVALLQTGCESKARNSE